VSNERPLYHPNIRVSVDGYVTTVTIDSPETKNACTGDMWVALGATFRDLSYSGTRAIVLTGAGSDFCAGADLTGAGGSGGDGSEGRGDHILHGMRVLGDVVASVHDCPVPVVARVDGVCVGAGFGLALAADMIWCSDRARFSAIFARRGLSLDFGTSWLLRQRIGVHRAKEIAFTGRIIGAGEARELGLVNGVVPIDELDGTVGDVASAVASGPPLALSMIKRQLDNASLTSLSQALEAETLAQTINAQTDDLQEAMVAFIKRRNPTFKGR
jgi:enoyl-CoA hydratase/carnithine racemase